MFARRPWWHGAYREGVPRQVVLASIAAVAAFVFAIAAAVTVVRVAGQPLPLSPVPASSMDDDDSGGQGDHHDDGDDDDEDDDD